jgi:hypothetical protein
MNAQKSRAGRQLHEQGQFKESFAKSFSFILGYQVTTVCIVICI